MTLKSLLSAFLTFFIVLPLKYFIIILDHELQLILILTFKNDSFENDSSDPEKYP